MEIKLIASTGNLRTNEEFLKFSQACGRVCYSEKDFEELQVEPVNNSLVDRMLKSGHHSVFEHINFTFYIKGLPKALAMVLNNEHQYATSEKSARYTQMKDIESQQKLKYDKWIEIFFTETDKIYPEMKYTGKRKKNIKKLAQENARYVTSVFTPTKMVHTLNLRQLNFIMDEFDSFSKKETKDNFNKRLIPYMQEFNKQLENFKIPGLTNQTHRNLSFFGDKVEEYFGSIYSTNYLMSFAALGQAHRHRTIHYHVSQITNEFFVPEIISKNPELSGKWISDLISISKDDYPQAQLLEVNELGLMQDFCSKIDLRLCGHAQYEIMRNTLETAKKYTRDEPKINSWIKPKCLREIKCYEPCVWTGKKALERII